MRWKNEGLTLRVFPTLRVSPPTCILAFVSTFHLYPWPAADIGITLASKTTKVDMSRSWIVGCVSVVIGGRAYVYSCGNPSSRQRKHESLGVSVAKYAENSIRNRM